MNLTGRDRRIPARPPQMELKPGRQHRQLDQKPLVPSGERTALHHRVMGQPASPMLRNPPRMEKTFV